jgi:hypothetical protein
VRRVDVHPAVVVDEDVDHPVGRPGQLAEVRELEVDRELMGGHVEAGGEVGEGGRALGGQPRQHGEEALQAAFAGLRAGL